MRPEYVNFPRLSARFDHAASQHHHFTMNLDWERESLPPGRAARSTTRRALDDVDEHMSVQLNHKWIRSPTHLNELYLKAGHR